MNPTATPAATGPARRVPAQRSVRGSVAALSAVCAVGGHAVDALRATSVTVVNDSVAVLYTDAADARTAAVLLRIPAHSHLRTVTPSGRVEHTWRGDVAGYSVTVTGHGILPEETPGRLLAVARRRDDAWADGADLGPCPDDVHAALVDADTTPAVTA